MHASLLLVGLLVAAGEQPKQFWIERLKHPNPLVREESVVMLAASNDKALLPHLKPLFVLDSVGRL